MTVRPASGSVTGTPVNPSPFDTVQMPGDERRRARARLRQAEAVADWVSRAWRTLAR